MAISNRNYAGKGSMLDIWIRNVRRSNVTNAMIVALDEETLKFAQAEQIPSLIMSLKVKPMSVVSGHSVKADNERNDRL